MTSKKSSAPASYWLVYGFGEGPRHGHYLHTALREAGFTPAKSFAAADIIIAHSGGCLGLPDAPGKVVYFCQPAAGWQHSAWYIWYEKTRLEIMHHRQRQQLRRWAWKSALNMRYLIGNPSHAQQIVTLAKRHKTILPAVQGARLVVIVGQDDPWSNGISLATFNHQPTGTYIGTSGSHDDMWTHPTPLVDIIKATHEA